MSDLPPSTVPAEAPVTKEGKPLIVACIPAYNEERTIAKVVLLAKGHAGRVVVCDDGSSDMTAKIAEGLGATVLRHVKNMGKGVALRTLFDYAEQLNPDAVVALDADGQHDPREIPRIAGPVLEGAADVVVGSRYVTGSKADIPFYRRVGLGVINLLAKGVSRKIARDTQSGFRAFSPRALEIIKQCESEGFGVEAEQLAMALKHGLRVVEVPITVRYKGLERPSKKAPARHGAELIWIVLKIVIEERPLLLLGVPGIMMIAAGIATGAHLVWLFNVTRYFSVPIALVTLGALSAGMMLLVASLILHAVAKLKPRIVRSN